MNVREPEPSALIDRAPSHTALRVAALRALHQTFDAPPVFEDPLAERILGPSARMVLDRYRATASETVHLRATLAARGVVSSQTISDGVARGIRQCVILGAGLDTFAYRNTSSGLHVFEVDHPKTQAWKRDVLREAEIVPPPSLTFVEADFERDDVLAALAAAGYRTSQPAVFVMLGVSFYLARDTLLALFGRLGAEFPDGTEIVFDYSEPLDRAPQADKARYAAAAARVAAAGEPWITFFTPTEIARALESRGFSDLTDIDAPTQNARWFAGRDDRLAVAPLAHLVRARKGI